MRNKHQKKQRSWVSLHVPSMEADLAYFEARLVLIGDPDTVYQRAQQRTYQVLECTMREMISRLRSGSSENEAKTAAVTSCDKKATAAELKRPDG